MARIQHDSTLHYVCYLLMKENNGENNRLPLRLRLCFKTVGGYMDILRLNLDLLPLCFYLKVCTFQSQDHGQPVCEGIMGQ